MSDLGLLGLGPWCAELAPCPFFVPFKFGGATFHGLWLRSSEPSLSSSRISFIEALFPLPLPTEGSMSAFSPGSWLSALVSHGT